MSNFFSKHSRQAYKFNRAWLVLLAVLILILLWRGSDQYNRPQIVALPDAPSAPVMQFIAASDQAFAYRVLIFWLQQFDVQAGQYVSFKQIDYSNLTDWLRVINQLEPASQYPMLLATRVYSRVADSDRVRTMLDYVYKQYLADPVKNWRWLAEATITAQHKLKDQPLALKYATALAEQTSKEIPYWAKDMRLIILEKMGEIEQVKLLVGGLISTQAVTDLNEIRFLSVLMRRI
ncbi:MAG: hypothetical protein OEY29_08495, partial [Gammaproteobacteria bacterium]|nr:hypothetical protein [Gammaproteobacteria bacterium]